MIWFRQIGQLEYLFLSVFLLLYVLFGVRTWIISRRLQSRMELFWVKFVLRTFYLILLIISILGPSFGGLKKEVKAVGKDILIAIDLSQSMNCTDVQPSRLEKTKFELKNVLQSFAADRVGIIVFSEEAFVYCPFTFDKSALNTLLETVNTKVIPTGGTDFGKPLELAKEKFREMETSSKKVSSKLILLVSDGEDFGDDTDEAIALLEKDGIRVFTLGVGTVEGAKVPSPSGGDLADEDGQPILAKLRPADLRKLASETSGKYYEVSNDRNEVPALIDAMESIEGEVRDVQMIDVGANKYYYFLFFAGFLFIVDVLFTINIIKI